MTTLVLLEGKVRPGGLRRLEEFLVKQLPATRAFDGCQSLNCYVNKEDLTFVAAQRWDSRSHYEAYLAWRKETNVYSEFEQLIDGEVLIRYFEQLGV